MTDDRPEFFTEADFERRKAIPTWATIISPGCICTWQIDEGEPPMAKMLERQRDCEYHGINGVL